MIHQTPIALYEMHVSTIDNTSMSSTEMAHRIFPG